MKELLAQLRALEFEEKVLNTGALLCLLGVFLPWFGGEWLGGETANYNGFSFYTSLMGTAIFLLSLALLVITVVPLTGGPVIIARRHREGWRLLMASQTLVLLLCSLSVLTKATLEFARMDVRFGIYVSMIGAMISTLYAGLRFQEQRRRQVEEIFHSPPAPVVAPPKPDTKSAPLPAFTPPAPPVATAPEEHVLHR